METSTCVSVTIAQHNTFLKQTRKKKLWVCLYFTPLRLTLYFTLFSLLLPCQIVFSLLKSSTFLSSSFIPIPQRLSIFTRVAVISSWHRFNPSSAYQTFPPFLISLYITPLLHLGLYVSIGLSILLRPGSKLKWFWGSIEAWWNLKRKSAMKRTCSEQSVTHWKGPQAMMVLAEKGTEAGLRGVNRWK